MNKLKILLFGCGGQIGNRLKSILEKRYSLTTLTRSDVDLTNLESIKATILNYLPNVIINAAAYTDVDKAESEDKQADLVNNIAQKAMACAAKDINALLICYSSDYIFDGKKHGKYIENDMANPLSVYGKSKLKGEKAVIYSGCKYINLRTSWIYDVKGKNFINTIIKLAKEKKELKVVNDQVGAPTSAKLVAEITAQMIDLYNFELLSNNNNSKIFGTFHLTNSGYTSWYGLAVYVIDQLEKNGVIFKCTSEQIKTISTKEYEFVANRPLNSRLNTEKICKLLNIKLPHWKVSIDKIISEII